MSTTPKTRRRWPYVLALASALAILAPFAWHSRPLTATERKLVGTWEGGLGLTHMQFGADRILTFEAFDGTTARATWHVSGDGLYTIDLAPDPRVASLSWYQQILPWIQGERHIKEATFLEFDDPDSPRPRKLKLGPPRSAQTELTRVDE